MHIKYSINKINKIFGKEESFDDKNTDLLEKAMGNDFSRDIRYHIPLLEKNVIQIENLLESVNSCYQDELHKLFDCKDANQLNQFKFGDKLKRILSLAGDTTFHQEMLFSLKCNEWPNELNEIYSELNQRLTFVHEEMMAMDSEYNQLYLKAVDDFTSYGFERKKQIKERHESVPHGCVYILVNTVNSSIIKIGYTSRKVELRLKEINRLRLVPGDFEVHWSVEVDKPYLIEQQIISELKVHCVGPELFVCDKGIAVEVAGHVIQKMDTQISNVTL